MNLKKVIKVSFVSLLLSTVLYGNDTVLQIQKELMELGYNPGTVDGIMGEQTSSAIRFYQEDNGLAVTGRANNALLVDLKGASEPTVSSTSISQKPKVVHNSTSTQSSFMPNFISKINTTNSIFSYNYVEAGYRAIETELINGISIDGNVLHLLGSFDVVSNINLLADYQKYSYDYDIEGTIWSVGVGYHQKVQEKTDIIFALKYHSSELTKVLGENIETDNDDSAFGFEAGARYEVFYDLEANAIFSFKKWNEGDDSDKSFIIGVRYDITRIVKLANKITVGAKFTAGDDSGFGVSLRGEF